MKKDVEILSVKFNSSSKNELLRSVKERLAKGQKTRIFTPNPQILLQAQRDYTLTELLQKADVNIPDGIGLMYASRLLGSPLTERISGIDLAEDLMRLAESEGYSVYLLGGKKGAARRAARKLGERFPRLNICGCHNGYFAKYGEENLRVRAKIFQKAPDMLFVCFGFPLQEKWIAENLHYLPTVKVAVGLGGSIDVWSGKIRRAPILLRTLGIEWLWRVIIEPKRIKIFADIPKFFFCVAKEKIALRKKAKRI